MEPIQIDEKKSLKQTVIEEIKQYIIENHLTAGDKLPTERAFTELFGVSRSVVREALSYLENIGIIRVRQGQGAFLNESNIENLLSSFFFLWQINNANIRDMLGLRVIFECSAVDDIVSQGNHEAIMELRQLVDAAAHIEEADKWREADIHFHQQLLQTTQNELFIQLTNMITHYFFQVQHIELSQAEYMQTIEEHRQIVTALEKGDAMYAKALLTKHINQAKA